MHDDDPAPHARTKGDPRFPRIHIEDNKVSSHSTSSPRALLSAPGCSSTQRNTACSIGGGRSRSSSRTMTREYSSSSPRPIPITTGPAITKRNGLAGGSDPSPRVVRGARLGCGARLRDGALLQVHLPHVLTHTHPSRANNANNFPWSPESGKDRAEDAFNTRRRRVRR